MPAEKFHWGHLFEEVVTSGLCTGCAGCIVACPHDVLGYDDAAGHYKPFNFEEGTGPGECSHGDRGCTLCTRACPRFRNWEDEADSLLFGRLRELDEVAGISKDIVLARAVDAQVLGLGQDGGLVSAILLWALDHGVIDAALVSYLEGDGSTWKAVPGVARTREEVLASAGSRYTYSANLLAYNEAIAVGRGEAGARRHGMPDVDAAGDDGAEGRQGRPSGSPSRSGCCARRRSTTRSSRSCSRRSTG